MDIQLLEKQDEYKVLSDRVRNYDKGVEDLKTLESVLDTSPDYQLSEPQGLTSSKTYKNKVAEPLVKKLKELLKRVLARCFQAWDNYYRPNITNGNLHRENERLTKSMKSWREKMKICVNKIKITGYCARRLGINR